MYSCQRKLGLCWIPKYAGSWFPPANGSVTMVVWLKKLSLFDRKLGGIPIARILRIFYISFCSPSPPPHKKKTRLAGFEVIPNWIALFWGVLLFFPSRLRRQPTKNSMQPPWPRVCDCESWYWCLVCMPSFSIFSSNRTGSWSLMRTSLWVTLPETETNITAENRPSQ